MKNKIILTALVVAFVLCAFTGCTDVMSLQAEIATLESERDMYADQAKDLEKKNNQYKSEVDDYKDIEKEYESYKSAMAEYEGLAQAEAEARKIEAEKAIQESKEAAEKASIAEKESREAEEALGYETGITYDQLARTPDDFKDKKVKFTGKVLQVMEHTDKDFVHIRLAVDSDYNSVLYCEYKTNIITSRILEDDIITIYGTSYGLYSYEATSGATITIPAVIIDKIDTKIGGGTSGGDESDLTTGQRNALKKAISILGNFPYSYSGLIERLERDEYTHEESVFAADNCGADWNEQAAKKAESCLKYSSYSREGLIARLEREGFTHEQAVYGAEQNGY